MVTITYDTKEEFLFMKAAMDAGQLNMSKLTAKQLLSLGIKTCDVTYQPSEKYKQEKEKEKMYKDITSESLKQNEGIIIRRDGFTDDHTRVRGPKEEQEGHTYIVENSNNGDVLETITFQRGPIKEYGVNGIHNEDLILILIDRIERFQKTPYACKENEEALTHLYSAVAALRKRTNDRKERGVLGTSQI